MVTYGNLEICFTHEYNKKSVKSPFKGKITDFYVVLELCH